MESKELMVGDWVRCITNGEYHQIYRLNIGDRYIADDGLYAQYPDIINLLSDVEGIPLTEEILKVNGFKNYINDYGNPSLRLKGTDDANDVNGLCYIDWTLKGDGCRGKLFDGFLYILMNIGSIHRPCKFVHELQHALRLCGLNDIADNFKIES